MDEILQRDQNHIVVLGGITDDAGENITMLRVDPITKRLQVTATVPGTSGGQVKITTNDTTYGYIGSGKLVAGTGITLTVNNPGGNETLTIAASGGSSGYNLIQNNGVSVTARSTINLSTLLTATDSGGKTALTINVTNLAADSTFITAITSNTTFLNNIANSATFVNTLVANNTFTTALAGNTNFINTLTANSTFQSNIVTVINNDSSISIDLTSQVTGVLPVSNGGTNIASYAVGDLIYASGATTLSKLADVATGNVLLSGGIATAPAYGKVGLTTHVSGILPLANGGTAANLADPGANRLWGWDDTDNSIGFWTIGSGLSYDHSSHTLSSVPGSTTYTAAQDVVQGDPIGASSGKEGYVSIASYALKNVSTGGTQIDIDCDSIFIDTDKFVATTNGGDVIVGIIDTSDNTITLGTVQTVAGGNVQGLAKIDTNKFVLVYKVNNGGTYEVWAQVGTVSGTTVTLGTAVLANGNIGNDNGGVITVESCTTDRAVVVFTTSVTGAQADINANAISISGTVITVGGNNNIQGSGTGFLFGYSLGQKSIDAISSSAYALLFRENNGGSKDYSVIIFTQSGTSLTIGTAVLVQTTSTGTIALQTVTNNQFYIVIDQGGGPSNYYYTTVSGTVPTVGAVFVGGDVTSSWTDGTDLFINMVSTGGSFVRCTVSGTTISESTDGRFYAYPILFIQKYQNGYNFTYQPNVSTADIWIGGMSNNFIGVANATAAKGASILVQLSGEATITQNVNSGSYYRVESGVFTLLTGTTLPTYNAWGTVKGTGINKIVL